MTTPNDVSGFDGKLYTQYNNTLDSAFIERSYAVQPEDFVDDLDVEEIFSTHLVMNPVEVKKGIADGKVDAKPEQDVLEGRKTVSREAVPLEENPRSSQEPPQTKDEIDWDMMVSWEEYEPEAPSRDPGKSVFELPSEEDILAIDIEDFLANPQPSCPGPINSPTSARDVSAGKPPLPKPVSTLRKKTARNAGKKNITSALFPPEYPGDGKLCASKLDLGISERENAGQVQFSCNETGCEKRFMMKSSFMRHIQSHQKNVFPAIEQEREVRVQPEDCKTSGSDGIELNDLILKTNGSNGGSISGGESCLNQATERKNQARVNLFNALQEWREAEANERCMRNDKGARFEIIDHFPEPENQQQEVQIEDDNLFQLLNEGNE